MPATAARWARRGLDGRRQAVQKPHGDQSGDHPEDDAGTAALRAYVNVIQERPHKQNIPEPRPIYSPWGGPPAGGSNPAGGPRHPASRTARSFPRGSNGDKPERPPNNIRRSPRCCARQALG